ncbi:MULTISPECIES: hydroxymethylglutaryl-CoA lyase [Bacillus]|jgi:hydroxymethylglutaryl-CoA lyase|uniref:Hydroxymethylglutaryl-CoA lyase n=1 Tax=Bacillus amyloliquefaciens (strain ATCC 23350 / DSM 7 / BCRC 11601 / CCUG 28519 / NBRC 15535 / NRRL B-14393 / F) TaxID=692420 RepID=A0A9P1NHJ7_BACAS|nr:hydroxymethylglutaryl-CoA lyase [Bacillus amyloliquefaciens]AIW33836.1 hydroxymethylglutaryl-CoA lyase [Bacillus subtilis]AEB23744.1 hydroxymethylglutaryl-CoA lyase [Bacillus amyloliquefaciens TA208]AEB63559.1 putative hydroxymethylglutaryl-CoA lyase [Bacillus amyloliquefaciens LL3]AEK88738.1 hydroxymethylglutaryl-CoA lyase [Bacillus amyloliquefaciens XH7]ARW39182.1 Hydroxymethylglutaryl-CoA lyase [Bacillus amyloliquefaciens]
MNCPKHVRINEVGPRDGLQNESAWVDTEDKIEWINMLSKTGLPYIEVTSFVHPRWIPALRDSLDVAKGIARSEDTVYAALVPNLIGLEHAAEGRIDQACVFLSASETHNQKNVNKPIDRTVQELRRVITEAKAEKMATRAYLSTVFGCPYEQNVPVEQVVRLADTLIEMGVDELSLGDTIGAANPLQVIAVLEALLPRIPASNIALHFHDTRGTALANIIPALDMGITSFDTSSGGLGGCPYAPGSAGNAATEDVIYMLEQMGIDTGTDLNKLLEAAGWIGDKIGKDLPSRNLQVFRTK